jgi:hypothetical protein
LHIMHISYLFITWHHADGNIIYRWHAWTMHDG